MSGLNFDDRAREILAAAPREADGFGHQYVATGHLLLAVLHFRVRSNAATVLRTCRVEPKDLRAKIVDRLFKDKDPKLHLTETALIHLPCTYAAKKAIELAIDSANKLNDDHTGDEHLLLGLIREGSGIAAEVLSDAGITVRSTALKISELRGEPLTEAAIHSLEQTQADAKQAESNVSNEPSERTALVCDDDTRMRRAIRAVLVRDGIKVVGEAENGIEAVARYKELNPDLVTMDIIMPEMTGLDALREILTLDPAARILVCTVIDQEAMIAEALQAGAMGCVLKPFTLSDLLDAVRAALAEPDPGER